MTEAEFLAWLDSSAAMRVVLVEAGVSVGGVETTRLMADRAYNTAAGVPYLPIVRGGISFNETLPLNGAPSLSTGSIEIDNANGERDSWRQDVWTNRPIQVFIGDMRWPRGDFRRIFVGTIARPDARNASVLNLVLRDKLQRLNTPISEATIGGAGTNKDVLLPTSFGECFNISPILVNEATHEYQFHIGQAERVIEVRDNGVQVTRTDLLATGRFRLLQSPAGQITASVQGHAAGGYRNTVAGLVQVLATSYGTPQDRFTAADLDLAQLAAFDSAHPQPVGIWIPDRGNVLAVCQELAASVGAQVSMSRQGLLRLLKIQPPGTGTPRVVTPADMVAGSLAPASSTDVQAGVRLGFARNWTLQTALETGIPAAHRKLFEEEFLECLLRDANTAALYRLHGEPEIVGTNLLRVIDAQYEAVRRLVLWNAPRTIYRFTGFASLMLLELGQALTIVHPRYGMSSGVTGQVVGLGTDWTRRRVTVEVLV